MGCAVRHGIEVGHGADDRAAASGRCAGAGEDGLLIRKTRLAKVNMHIAEAGKNGIFRIGFQGKCGKPIRLKGIVVKTDELHPQRSLL